MGRTRHLRHRRCTAHARGPPRRLARARGAREVGRGLSGVVKIGVTAAIGPAARKEVAQALRAGAGELSVSVREIRVPDIRRLLRDRLVDLVFIRSTGMIEGAQSASLRPTPAILCAPESHPLAANSSVRLGQLDGARLLTWNPPGTPFTDAIFGATGAVGRHVTSEALARGHEVTAVVRDPGRATDLPRRVGIRTGDARRAVDVTAASVDHDVLISATRPAAGREQELVATARALLAGLAGTGTRLVLVGGAATLTVPGSGGTHVIDHPTFRPPAAARELAWACIDQLAACRTDGEVDWTYLSPPARLQPGLRTGHYRLGDDELVIDEDGDSTLSHADLAVVLLDEVDQPRHPQRRYTAAY